MTPPTKGDFKPLLHMYVEHMTTEDKDKGAYWYLILLCGTHCSPAPFPPRLSTAFNPSTAKQKKQQNPKETNKNF
jgi:hypothetical protein